MSGFTYTAGSLADVAAMFEARAADCRQRACRAARQRNAVELNATARTWDEAATVLRATTLVQSGEANNGALEREGKAQKR